MATVFDFRADLPAADVQIGPGHSIRVYGFADIEPPLVEMRVVWRRVPQVFNLTVEQAEALAAGLKFAADRARGMRSVD